MAFHRVPYIPTNREERAEEMASMPIVTGVMFHQWIRKVEGNEE